MKYHSGQADPCTHEKSLLWTIFFLSCNWRIALEPSGLQHEGTQHKKTKTYPSSCFMRGKPNSEQNQSRIHNISKTRPKPKEASRTSGQNSFCHCPPARPRKQCRRRPSIKPEFWAEDDRPLSQSFGLACPAHLKKFLIIYEIFLNFMISKSRKYFTMPKTIVQ